jgi:MerR family transcriptional regulator, light-induced transcriptional regulator
VDAQSPPGLRIGELSRRTGISAALLRTWERRYGLLGPTRTAAGYRLYTDADEQRVRRMQAFLARGLSAAQAAAAVDRTGDLLPSAPPPATWPALASSATALADALDAFDEPAAQALLDELLANFTVDSVLGRVIMPYLRNLGDRWASGQASVACEHFASQVLRGRLAGLARGWGHGYGPRALLACPPGEQHDLGLLTFGIVLHRDGWQVRYLGADTPVGDLARAVSDIRPDMAVLAAVTTERFQPHTADLARLSAVVPLGLAGAGGTEALARAADARLLAGDPVGEARQARAWAATLTRGRPGPPTG